MNFPYLGLHQTLVQYKTWCHKNGRARTLDGKLIDWNSELIWKMRIELDLQWDLLEEEVPIIFEKLKSSISKWLQFLKVYLEGEYICAQNCMKLINIF